MAELQKVKAVTDGDGHWYVIPANEIDVFNKMLKDGEFDEWNAFNERFGEYRTGGDLNSVQLFAEL